MWKYTCLKKPNYTKGFQHHVHQFSNVSLWLLVECRLLRKPWQVLGATEDGSLSAVMSKKNLMWHFCHTHYSVTVCDKIRADLTDATRSKNLLENWIWILYNKVQILFFPPFWLKNFCGFLWKIYINVHFNSLTFTIPV